MDCGGKVTAPGVRFFHKKSSGTQKGRRSFCGFYCSTSLVVVAVPLMGLEQIVHHAHV